MAIEKSLNPAPKGLEEDREPIEISIEGATTTENDDGSVVIDLSGGADDRGNPLDTAHDENLAEKLPEDELIRIASELRSDIDADLQSRSDWEKVFADGMKLLGLTIETRTEPWDGACGVVHPVLAEAVVRFQSEMMTETFPPAGPVKAKILGRETQEKIEAAERVRTDMNIELTDRMTEYRREHERLLWNLPIMGTALKKIYFDPTLDRQSSMFVSAEDFIVANGTTDLRSCPRYTQSMKVTRNDLKKMQVAGMYRQIDLDEPMPDAANPVTEEKNKLSGQGDGVQVEHHTLYESCCELTINGLEESENASYDLPYVVTLDKASNRVLAIRRNWDEKDPKRQKRQYFVDYHYIPGFGFYSFGLLHLVGGFAEGATAILRQLVDAGTLSNLPGGLKTKGLRIKGDDDPIGPGEWRDVDVPGGMLKENLMPLPYKEPSVVLAGLLDKIVEEGRKLAAVAEMKIADFDANSPVGTTMALLERTLKVMTAVQSRIFDSMKYEFRLLKRLIQEHGSDIYEYEPEHGDVAMRKQDYAAVDILPVADPNAATMSQRIVQYQAAMQLIQMAPQIYDLPYAHGQMLTVLNIQNAEKFIPALKAQTGPRDPVSENMALLQMQPVKAFPYQDHQSHIVVHMNAMQDPMIQQMIGQNPQAQQISAAAHAHVVEHLAFEYRNQIEKMLGTMLPPPDEPLPPAVEYQLSSLIAAASQKLLGQNQAFMQQMAQMAAQNDPVAQQQMMEAQIKMREVARKEKKDAADHQVDVAKLALEEKQLSTSNTITAVQEVLKMLQAQQDREFQAQQGKAKLDADAMREKTGMARDIIGKTLDRKNNERTMAAQQAHESRTRAEDRMVEQRNRAEDRIYDAANRAADRKLKETTSAAKKTAKPKTKKADK